MSIVKLLEYVFCLDNNIHIVVFPLVQDSLIKYLQLPPTISDYCTILFNGAHINGSKQTGLSIY